MTETETTSQQAHKTMYLFGTFKRSDRIELRRLAASEGGDDVFVEALQMFLERWDRADWIEAYNIERVAKWCARHLDRSLQDRLGETFRMTRLVRTGGQDAFGVFLTEFNSWQPDRAADGPPTQGAASHG